MAVSSKYNSLKSRISQLESHLLPQIDPFGAYSLKDQDLIRSYCLLCHAEIESYLENYTLEIVTRAYNKWNTDKRVTSTIIFHLAFNQAITSKDLPYSLVVKSFLALKKVIEGNNGIKENNLTNFFKPIGFDIDQTLKTTLTEFGKNRGEIAHTSFQTQQPLDPVTEKANINLILMGLENFDEELDKYEQTGLSSKVNIQWEKYNFFDRIKILFFGRK